MHRCLDCLRSAIAGELIDRLRRERDEVCTWAREMWVTSGPPWLRDRSELGPPPGWLTERTEQL